MNDDASAGRKAMTRFIAMLCLLALQACSSLPEITSAMPGNWSDSLAQKQQISAWKISGRLAVQTEHQGGTLDLFWKQRADSYQIRLIAPMGQGTILIKGNPQGVSVKTAEGEYFDRDADVLLASMLDVEVPVTGLRDWIRGMPMQQRPVERQHWDGQGRLHKLVQDDWNIEMSDYRPVAGQALPHKFYLSRDDRPELDIRLLIRQWTLPAEQLPL